jgi:hypothetical protein
MIRPATPPPTILVTALQRQTLSTATVDESLPKPMSDVGRDELRLLDGRAAGRWRLARLR